MKPLVVPIGAALERYLGDTGLDRHTLARQSLEMVIGAWLRDVIKGVATEGLPEDFITALRRGRLSSEEELDS